MGEDLLLLSIRRRGDEYLPREIGPALRIAELVELAAAGRIRLDDDLIKVSDRTPTGAEPLDQALETLWSGAKTERWIKDRIDYKKPSAAKQYATRLAAQGLLRIGAFGLRPEYTHRDTRRRAQALARAFTSEVAQVRMLAA